MENYTLLRHGRSVADDENVFEARYDARLTEVGEEQARLLGERWKTEGRSYDLVVASPLKRAARTAEIIAEALSAPVETDERWLEIDAGGLSGLPKDEGLKRFPTMNDYHGPYDRIAGGTGESESQVHARALYALEALINMGARSCLVVSHGAFLNAAVRMVFGIPIPVNRNGSLFRFRDTGYMDLAYRRENHRWVLLGFTSGG